MAGKKVIRATIYPDRGVVSLVKLYPSVKQEPEECSVEGYYVFKARNAHIIDFKERTNLSMGARAN